ncbi:MAG: hypothetical protein A4E29_00031 [Methanomassiliicoccales archaeon PtaB.Bin134]|nr:MAG: hypothetical protein A4E29_00031 [Methanomassiliicoccales archaeon PtaB.Bin134]
MPRVLLGSTPGRKMAKSLSMSPRLAASNARGCKAIQSRDILPTVQCAPYMRSSPPNNLSSQRALVDSRKFRLRKVRAENADTLARILKGSPSEAGDCRSHSTRVRAAMARTSMVPGLRKARRYTA